MGIDQKPAIPQFCSLTIKYEFISCCTASPKKRDLLLAPCNSAVKYEFISCYPASPKNFNSPDEPLPLVFSVVLAARVARLAPIIRHQKMSLSFPSSPQNFNSPLLLAFPVVLACDPPLAACNKTVSEREENLEMTPRTGTATTISRNSSNPVCSMCE